MMRDLVEELRSLGDSATTSKLVSRSAVLWVVVELVVREVDLKRKRDRVVLATLDAVVIDQQDHSVAASVEDLRIVK